MSTSMHRLRATPVVAPAHQEKPMLCPRCPDASLTELDRDGVTIDRCERCRGIWLDRGELEKLIARARDAEAPPPTTRGESPRPVAAARADDDERYRRRDDDDDDDDRRREAPRRKRSWLDIFD